MEVCKIYTNTSWVFQVYKVLIVNFHQLYRVPEIGNESNYLRESQAEGRFYIEWYRQCISFHPNPVLLSIHRGYHTLVLGKVYNRFLVFLLFRLVSPRQTLPKKKEQILNSYLFRIHRTPYELNTGLRKASIVLFEALVGLCILSIIASVTCVLVATMIYVEAYLLDIKSIFLEVDRLSKHKNMELEMFKCCKEAIDLHDRVLRYIVLLFQN